MIGMYDITEFCIRLYLELHRRPQYVKFHSLVSNTHPNNNSSLAEYNNNDYNINDNYNWQYNYTYFTNYTTFHIAPRGELYGDSAFAQIVFGCVDMIISGLLLYVVAYRR